MLNVHAKKLGTTAILCLQGRIVIGETEILHDAVQSLSEAPSDVSAVILDLTRVTTVDACGLGVMLELRAQAESRGILFELMNVTNWVRSVLEITRLDSVFQITSGVECFPAVSRSQRAALTSHGAFSPRSGRCIDRGHGVQNRPLRTDRMILSCTHRSSNKY